MYALFITAWVFAAFGSFVTGFNFYLSFLRYPLHKWRHGVYPDKWSSGVPGIGSFCLYIAAALFSLTGHKSLVIWILLATLPDTGGPHWFIWSQLPDWRNGWRNRKEKEVRRGKTN